MKRVVAMLIGMALTAGVAGATPGPGPGEPFGGDDSGCVPLTSPRLYCAGRVGRAFRVLIAAVSRCHTRLADRGRVLANVGVPYTGAAPDLGALERGCPLPVFGVRPLGVDESNEPLGCAP